MGLDTTHGAFHGAYSAFNRLRQAICRAAGGSFPYHEYNPDDFPPHKLGVPPDSPHVEPMANNRWYVPDYVSREEWPGLYIFLEHEDCEGSISPADCVKIANDLEKLLPALEKFPEAFGHLGRPENGGSYVGATRLFIGGCRLAASRGETLEFH